MLIYYRDSIKADDVRALGFEGFELIDAPVIDGHPRLLGGSDPARSPESRTGACPPVFGSFFKFRLWLPGQNAIDRPRATASRSCSSWPRSAAIVSPAAEA